MARSAVVVAFVVVVLSTGCPPPTCEVLTPLVDGESWAFVPPSEDATWPPPADAAPCGDDAIQQQVFDDVVGVEIDTRLGCGHATVVQGIGAPIAAGDEVQLRVFYFSQTTFPAAEAAVAVTIGDETVLDARVPIPTTSGLLSPRVRLERDHPVGTPARFHVGNHGDNSWNLVELSLLTAGACPAGE